MSDDPGARDVLVGAKLRVRVTDPDVDADDIERAIQVGIDDAVDAEGATLEYASLTSVTSRRNAGSEE